MAINIEAMRAKLNASQNGNKAKSNTGFRWRPSEGDQSIRILPTADGDPFKEFHFHYNVGKNPGILCPKKNYGEDCPICDFASKLWRDGVQNDDNTLKQEAKKLFVRKRYYSPIIVRGEEADGVKIWSYGKTAYETLLGYVLDPDYGDITDPETGTDVVLNYNIPGTPGSFPKTTLKPRRRPSVLCDEAVADCAELLDSIPEIESLFDRKSTSDVQAILDDFLSSDTSSESRSSETQKYSQKQSGLDEAFKNFMNNDD
tara:strand:+ start:1029 stop:1802 length:774 start_codon:yes stop_codon:yes gene_type:complete